MASTTTTAHFIPYLEIPKGFGEALELSLTSATWPGMRSGGGSAHTRQFVLENRKERERETENTDLRRVPVL
ncbi:hypothetical protein Sjap_008481 [Stephania japonica]|uniref:Uncharacterized protein n=1 Tax=Stephania japonica TaxID=461633 RepID=A0AAP0PBE0_9MAGN